MLANTQHSRQKILTTIHDSTLGGHSGIKILFYWLGQTRMVMDYIQSCQKAKHENTLILVCQSPYRYRKEHGLILQWILFRVCLNLEVKTLPWWLLIDSVKYGHFITLPLPFCASSVTKLFLDHTYKLYGQPISIVTDRDKVFTSVFWTQFFKLLGSLKG